MSEYQKPAPGAESDRLAHALAALKAAPVEGGPSPEVFARTLTAVEAAARSPRIPFLFRRNIMFAGLKIAAALLAAAGGVYLFSGPFLVGAPVTFAEVAGKLQKARTLAYTWTMQIPGERGMQSARMLFKEPGHMRVEALPNRAMVVIFDMPSGRCLSLEPAKKAALLLEGMFRGVHKPGSLDIAAKEVNKLRELADKHGEPVGEKIIGKVRAKGFRVVEATGDQTIVWADPGKRLPIQLDETPYGDKTLRYTISEIQLDTELDDSLFGTEPPAGYTVTRENLRGVGEEDVGTGEAAMLKFLRAYAQKKGGSFPKRLDEGSTYYTANIVSNTEKSMAVAIRATRLSTHARMFFFELKGNFTYKPEGVKLGDAGKVLLWYKPEGKETYRAIYGDLHVAELTADQLPAAEKPRPKR